jgi:hypothetical protein
VSRVVYCKGVRTVAIKFGKVWLCQACGGYLTWMVW